MTEKEIELLANRVVGNLIKSNKTLSLAESCTGGWLSKFVTDVSGVSAIYKGGVCSYSNEIKMKVLGVKEDTLKSHGAVSKETAYEMANGIRNAFSTDIGIGITGIAGPNSDDTKKPVGLIYIALADGKETKIKELRNNFEDDIRQRNRLSAVYTALKLLGDINE